MENDELKDLLQNDVPEVSYDSKAILQRCKQENNKFRIHKQKLSYVLSSIIVVLVIVFGIIFIYNKNNKEIRDINNAINNLEKIESDEIRMLEIMKIENEVKHLDKSESMKINMNKLNSISINTANTMKNQFDWKDYANMETDYIKLDELIDIGKINRIYIHKQRFSDEMWVCENEDFTINLMGLLNLPYIDLISNYQIVSDEQSEISIGDYTNYKSFTLYLGEKLINVGIFSDGYVVIKMNEDNGNIGLKEYVSLLKLDLEALENLISNERLNDYEGYLSLVSFSVQTFTIAMNSVRGPSMKFNLDDASFCCTIDYGSFKYLGEEKSIETLSDSTIQWSPIYIKENIDGSQEVVEDISETNNHAYMDVIIKIEGKIVGYIVIEMKCSQTYKYTIYIKGFELFKEDNNYQYVSYEYVMDKINKLKEK